jgi:hypothetical protein
MSYNMSYCRMQNTLGALQECNDDMDDGEMSDDELIARKRLIQLCIEIANNYEDLADAPIDFGRRARAQHDDIDYADRQFSSER